MCSEAPTSLARYIFTNVIELENFGGERNRKSRLSLLYTAKETRGHKRNLLWVIWPVGFRIRTIYYYILGFFTSR